MHSDSRPLHRVLSGGLAAIGAELLIIAFALAIATQIGASDMPVYDPLGPDRLPAILVILTIGLCCLEIVKKILAHRDRAAATEAPPRPSGNTLAAAGFVVATIAYVAALSQAVLPYFALTGLYFAATSLIIARKLNVVEVVVGLCIGFVLGYGLQALFTRVFVIDLPL